MPTRGADFKMAASMKEKVYCVLEHAKTSSVTVVRDISGPNLLKKHLIITTSKGG
jgi:hypothetical protein